MPYSERLETLKVLHLGHYAVDKMQLRALETVNWPGINKDILKYYQSCKTCIKYSKSQRNEPLQSQPTPVVPWHMIATDLFETKNSKYLLIVDYCEELRLVSPNYYHLGCIVDLVVLLVYYLDCVDRSGSLSSGAFNQLRLATLNIVLTILYLLKTVLQRPLLQCLNSLYKSDKVF